MYRLHLTKKFTKDAKKLNKNDLFHTMEVLKILEKGEKLDPKYKDHALKGKLSGARDCHIRFDLVLIYKYNNEVLEIVALRIGKHSEVFK